MSIAVKEKLYLYCEGYVNTRIDRLKKQLEELKASLGSETKSSAGDKHETGRAMLQLEQEKLGKQMYEAEALYKVLQQIPKDNKQEKVALGSLVTTNKHLYYIAVSAGKYEVDHQEVYCISASTPIGKLLLGKQAGDAFLFNGVQQSILDVK